MKLTSAIVLLSAALQAAVSAGASSASLRHTAAEERKLRKDRKDDDEESASTQDAIAMGDGEEVAGVVPQLRSLGDDDWNHGSFAVSAERSTSIKVYAPEDARPGDTLFLFLHRTDGFLPLRIDEWKRGAECFKSNNRQDECLRASHCVERDGPYCLKFRRDGVEGTGKDLATIVFTRKVTEDDPGCWIIDLPDRSTTWAVVTAITNVNEDKPIFRVAGRSCDREWESAFPSVYGETDHVLLLSQCFDDTAARSDFLPPDGAERLGWTNSYDEAGFLFGKLLSQTGQTGEQVTNGPGGPKCKDALLSVVVNRD